MHGLTTAGWPLPPIASPGLPDAARVSNRAAPGAHGDCFRRSGAHLLTDATAHAATADDFGSTGVGETECSLADGALVDAQGTRFALVAETIRLVDGGEAHSDLTRLIERRKGSARAGMCAEQAVTHDARGQVGVDHGGVVTLLVTASLEPADRDSRTGGDALTASLAGSEEVRFVDRAGRPQERLTLRRRGVGVDKVDERTDHARKPFAEERSAALLAIVGIHQCACFLKSLSTFNAWQSEPEAQAPGSWTPRLRLGLGLLTPQRANETGAPSDVAIGRAGL